MPKRTITLSLAEFRADMAAAHRLADRHTNVHVVDTDGSSYCHMSVGFGDDDSPPVQLARESIATGPSQPHSRVAAIAIAAAVASFVLGWVWVTYS